MTKKIDPQKLDASRDELLQAEGKLAAIVAGEMSAVDTPAMYDAWRKERDAARLEVDRLRKVVEHLEAAVHKQTQADELAALLKRADEQRRFNEDLSQRIRELGASAAGELIKLARDVAAASIEDARINSRLPEDVDRIVSADALARNRQLPREDISEKSVTFWVFEATGTIVGEQRKVVDLGGGRGEFPRGPGVKASGAPPRCVKRKFRSIRYREAVVQPFRPLFEALRLPNFDATGWLWNPRDDASSAQALATLDQLGADNRPILTEDVPETPWPTQSSNTEENA